MATVTSDDGGRTAWARNLAAPVRSFLSTETASAGAVVAAIVVALIWANVPGSHSYESTWTTRFGLMLGGHGIVAPLRIWINQGLMTLFFLVVGLEAKRQLDLGDLRDRRRLLVPVLAGLCGVAVPAAIYLAWNAGGPGAHGWGTAISTDTAFALSAIGLLAPRSATRLRVFLLSVAVVDDLAGLAVITIAYTTHVSLVALIVAAGLFAVLLALRWLPDHRQPIAIIVGIGVWFAMFRSGVDPVIAGLAMGLVTSAYPPAREDLSRALELTRTFREQPTPELARAAQRGLSASISANERMQYELHPWTAYLIVPLFALANGGIHINGTLLSDAVRSPITLGILTAYLIGKPLGVMFGSWLATRPALRGSAALVSPPVRLIGGSIAGMGFTVSLLIASLAFHGQRLAEAKLGTLATLICAPAITWIAIRLMRRLPDTVRARQLAQTAEDIPDLAVDVDVDRDHVRGTKSDDAAVTIVEYGDFECPFCGDAEGVIRRLLDVAGDEVRYVWRHLPLSDVHRHAQLASEAAEAAAAQGRFWEMYDILMDHQDALEWSDLLGYAEEIGLDVDRFTEDLRHRTFMDRIGDDVATADESGVTGTPTFFINGRRHYGVYDIEALTAAVRSAKTRARALRTAAAA